MTLLAELAATSARVGATPSRLAKAGELAALLRRLEPREVETAIAFLSGEIRQGKLSLGYAALRPGDAAASASLTLGDVESVFVRLKNVKGKGAAAARQRHLQELFARATAQEQDFLVRLIVGELRQGALEGLMLEAVAAASGVPAAEVRRAATFAGGIGPVAAAALGGGATALAQFAVQALRPVLPMLAQPAADIAAAMAAARPALVEWKLDGARIQVHKQADEVRVFTRNLNDVTGRVPEVVSAIRGLRGDLILDGEAIALRADGRPHPFQTTMSRFGSRLEVEARREALPLCAYYFDCLLLDGVPLVDAPLRERRAALAGALPAASVTPAVSTADAAAAERFYEAALAQGHEGVMVKGLESRYESGRRGAAWLKVKRAKTLDLVVLAAEWGSGRRRGWLSNLHLGARDPAGGFVMLGKTFKGLTDATLEWQTRELLAREIRREGHVVYVRPELVVEIAFNDLQQSSQYPAGLALRFARVKGYRADKRPEDADTLETVRSLA